MKKNNLKIWSVAYLMFFVLFTGTVFAQSVNLTGTFEGLRSQYDRSHQNFTEEFQYKFELVQEGDIVSGTSTIISDEGNYAEVGIRGVVVKNKFYFEEYNMLDQIRPENMVWCYKTGVLNISQLKNEITLSGETPSYMVNYGYACTGGFTKLSATNKSKDNKVALKNSIDNVDFDFSLYPNPTVERINFSFSIEERSKVAVEILDLTGKSVLNTGSKIIDKGNFVEYFPISQMGLSAGLYIFNLHVDDKVYSKEFVVAK